MNYLLVGCGAIGCELAFFLKDMPFKDVILVDPDKIEKVNFRK